MAEEFDASSADEFGNTKEYLDYLKEANETDLQSLERCECVRSSVDNNGKPVLYFLPRLGFIKSQSNSESQLRHMLLLFLKVAHEIVNKCDEYSIVYGHVQLSILSQQPLIFKYWQMLPRRYKKNLKKLYVLHPKMGIKIFFELSRVFVSTKFYNKLQYVQSIADLEAYISPSVETLPLTYIKFEDELNGLKPSGIMPPLELSFDSSLGTTPLIFNCCAYLRSANAVTRRGIFRIAGSDIALTLAKMRLQYDKVYDVSTYNASSSSRLIIIGKKGREDYASANSKRSHRNEKKCDIYNSLPSIFIDDVDTVAQILRMSLRDLADPLISSTAHASFVETTSKLVDVDQSKSDLYSIDDWEWDANMILDQMKEENKVTLANLLDFVAEFAHHSKENLMDFKNLAVSFTPTLMKFDATDPMSAMMELTIGQKIMQLLLRKVYKEKFGNSNVFDFNSMRFSMEGDQNSSRSESIPQRNGFTLPTEQIEENEDIERLSLTSETGRNNRRGVNLTRRPDSLQYADDIPCDDEVVGDEVIKSLSNRRGLKLSKDELSAVADVVARK